VKLRRIIAGVILGVSATASYAVDRPNVGLCEAHEKRIWICGKASLCGSPALTNADGYLQYRYGSRKRVELEFPATRNHTQEQFRFARYTRPQTTYNVIRFTNKSVAYDLYEMNEGAEGSKASYINVTMPDGHEKEIHCNGKGSLAVLEKVVPNEDFLK
jgi:hypothetical protein